MNIDRLYDIYKKKYHEEEFRAKKKYGKLYNSPEFGLLSKGEFRDMMDIKGREINSKYAGTTLVKIIDEQFYERMSNKQARALQAAIKEKTGKDYSLSQLKAGAYSPEFWNLVKEEQNKLRGRGLTPNEVAAIISQEFFGS